MLPLEQSWYKKLLLFALLLGAVGAVAALLFDGITGAGMGFFFSDAGIDWWTGKWWWIVLTALGGLLVSILRKTWKQPEQIPGSIKLANQGWVEPSNAIYWAIISTISLITGASLGPSFALIVMGGAFGSWLVTRLGEKDDDDASQQYTLTGMAGGLGAAFDAPLFATVLTSELSSTPTRNYVAAFIPQLLSATVGFVIFFSITGSSMMGEYALPAYEYHHVDLLVGVLLGAFSVVVLVLFALIKKLVSAAMAMMPNPIVRGGIGGALVGLIAFALPLTVTSGSSQLAIELGAASTIGIGFIAAVLVAKMLAIAISQSSGFLGGVVFPIIFIGGTAGLLVHTIFPVVPLSLAVAAMLAAVPGAVLGGPLSLMLIAAGTVSLGPQALMPVGIAVVTAHIAMAFVQYYAQLEHKANPQSN